MTSIGIFSNASNTLFHSKQTCTNCGNPGHHYRQCIDPIYSYGIIAFRHRDPEWNQVTNLAKNDTNFTGFKSCDIEFLLIQRKDSIGYIELIRGKYKINDFQYIRDQVAGTTAIEREKLSNLSFNELWRDVWGEENQKYKSDLEQAKIKFEQLKKGYTVDGSTETIQLEELFVQIPCIWDTPEWGFPKGRRNPGESDYDTACREFREETGLINDQFRVFENMKPLRETFFGNNHVQYCHVYYIGWIPQSVDIQLKLDNNILCQEIGNIGWFSLEEAFAKIRPTNIEKREILLRVSTILRNLSCLLIGPVLGQGQMLDVEGETNNRKEDGGRSGSGVTTATGNKEKDSWTTPPIKKTTHGSTYQFVEDTN